MRKALHELIDLIQSEESIKRLYKLAQYLWKKG